MDKKWMILACAAVFAAFIPAASAEIGDRTFVFQRGGDRVIIGKDKNIYRVPQEDLRVISGTIERVGHDELNIDTVDGRVDVDLEALDFGADIDDVFERDMNVVVRGMGAREHDIKALSIRFSKDGKTYTYKTTDPRYIHHIY
jgi:hypothetical protein